VSEQKPEQISSEPGSLSAGPTALNSSDAQSEPVASTPESMQGSKQGPKEASTDPDPPMRVPEPGGAAKPP
jgi:hypothetical protein